MIKVALVRVGLAGLIVLGLSVGAATPAAAVGNNTCEQWTVFRPFIAKQSNGYEVVFRLKQDGTRLSGWADYQMTNGTTTRTVKGNVSGGIGSCIVGSGMKCGAVSLRVLWTYSGEPAIGVYTGMVTPNTGGTIINANTGGAMMYGHVFDGPLYDEYERDDKVRWQLWSADGFRCSIKPPPLAPPVNPTAQEGFKNSAVVSWQFSSEDPRSLHFIVQQRITGQWVNLGNTGRHQADTYRLSVNYHRSDNPLRVCTSTTAGELRNCTEPVTPAQFGIHQSTRPNDTPMALLPPPPGIKQSAQVNDPRTAPHLGGSDTLNTQKVLPTLQQPSAIPQSSPPKALPGLSPSTSLGQNAVVNPQPLLLKPSTTTTLNSSTSRIFQRGVPLEGSPPAGTTPVEPKPAP